VKAEVVAAAGAVQYVFQADLHRAGARFDEYVVGRSRGY
jgi:hypothetical protein